MGLTELLVVTFIAALVTDLATGLGAVPFFFVRRLSPTFRAAFIAAAAGMMTTASVLQLVGEGIQLTTGIEIWQVGAGLFAGVFFFLAASRWIRGSHSFDIAGLRKKGGASAVLIVAALTLHSLPEGIAIGVAFGASPEAGGAAFGASVALALAVHNIPEGVALTLALRSRGISTWACMGWAIFSSIPQPLGAPPAAWSVWFFEPLLPAGLGFAAGAMMYLVVDELLATAFEGGRKEVISLAYMAGLIGMALMGRVVGLN